MTLNEYQLFIKRTFDSLKRKNKQDWLKCIPIYNDCGSLYGYLLPIVREFRTAMPDCAALLARWRNENPSMSADTFTATAEGTERWLDRLVINRDDRVLFLITGTDGAKIGHIGYSSFCYDKRCCEVDAVLRGEKTILPAMITFAINALVHWGLKDLRLEDISLRVFSDNARAIRFYQKNCFYIAEENPAGHSLEKQYTVMRLDKDMWKEKNGRNTDA